MHGFIEAAAQLDAQQGAPWLAGIRAEGKQYWQQQSFPTRKTESWKYTSLRKLEQGDYLNAPEAPPSDLDMSSLLTHFTVPDLDSCTLVFLNGQFSETLSTTAFPAGCELIRFANATAKEAAQIERYLGKAVNRQAYLFASLNDSWLADGLFLRIGKNSKVDRTIQLVWMSTQQNRPFSVAQRLLVVLEEGSQATVIEHFCSTVEPQNCFMNGITELILESNATLHHYRLQLEEEHHVHIGGVHANLGPNATLDSFHLGMGGLLTRIDIVVNHLGEGAHCELNGIYLPRHRQHIDYHTCIEHIAPGCTTTENFRGIISDEARAVFNGRIHIHKDAQKSAATLSNKNLLTSDKAEVDTKPELEIYADDVQCAHGATVAQLDDQSVYYLMSRGIERDAARVMLSYGFINALIDKLGSDIIGNYLRPQLKSRFAFDSTARECIA